MQSVGTTSYVHYQLLLLLLFDIRTTLSGALKVEFSVLLYPIYVLLLHDVAIPSMRCLADKVRYAFGTFIALNTRD